MGYNLICCATGGLFQDFVRLVGSLAENLVEDLVENLFDDWVENFVDNFVVILSGNVFGDFFDKSSKVISKHYLSFESSVDVSSNLENFVVDCCFICFNRRDGWINQNSKIKTKRPRQTRYDASYRFCLA